MLTRKEALYYDEQLHPAFAGYIFDGTVTERDVLSTLLHLLTRGVLSPIWKDGNMNKTIVGMRKIHRKPAYEFEEKIITSIFQDNQEASSERIKEVINSGEIQEIIKNNLRAIETFPIIQEQLNFRLGKHIPLHISINGETVDTVKEANQFNSLMKRFLLPLFIVISALLLFVYFLISKIPPGNLNYNSPNISIQGNIQRSPDGMLLTVGILLVTGIGMFLLFTFSRKTVSYSFKDDIIPTAKKKYEELYRFIKDHPLPKHKFVNEFLAFSIAFGLDDSWFKDFGLEKEINIDKTPITT